MPISSAAEQATTGWSEPLLRSLLATAPDAIILIEEDGVIHSVNGMAEQMFAYGASEMVGRNVNMLMPSPYRQEHDGYIARYLQTGERRIIGIGRIVAGERSDGSVFPMELHVGELQYEGRRLFSGFVRDLSGVRRAERRLQDLQSDFQKSVRLGSIGRMVSALAHELNQPVSAVMSYTEAAQDLLASGAPDAVKHAARAIGSAVKQAQRAGTIIGRMREFVARATPPRAPADLNTIIVEASALALSGTGRKDLRVTAHLEKNLPPVLIDKAAVQEVLYNLIRNAVQAMEGREPAELTIETSAGQERTQLVVAVSDTGPGLSAEARAQLYRPFMGASEGTHGLGLAISREIVEGYGSKLVAEDRPGGGTRFSFTLPIAM